MHFFCYDGSRIRGICLIYEEHNQPINSDRYDTNCVLIELLRVNMVLVHGTFVQRMVNNLLLRVPLRLSIN